MPCIRRSVVMIAYSLKEYWHWKENLKGFFCSNRIPLTNILSCRYSKENKFPSPRERKQFYAVIKEAEATVIREGNYQIGKQIIIIC